MEAKVPVPLPDDWNRHFCNYTRLHFIQRCVIFNKPYYWRKSMIELTCMCENKFSADIADTYDTGKNPETVESILSGNFLNAKCPACGKVLKPELNVLVKNVIKGTDIRLIPELERMTYLKNLKDKPDSSDRIVIGYPELIEKTRILKDGFDDQVIEYLKYLVLSKVLEKTAETDENDISITYNDKKGDEILFHIMGLKADEVGIFKVPVDWYKQAQGEIKA
ncbi:MAG: hypothetical protein EHM28_09650, partial [Spirochaetaceae bacterium]